MLRLAIPFLFSAFVGMAPPSFWSGKAFERKPSPDYPFLRKDLNIISNVQHLEQFYKLLRMVENKQARKVTILHIGDSHLQADFYSGELRRRLHQRFGSAGRGLIFPHTLAGTVGAYDITATDMNAWAADKIINPNIILPVGLSGFAIRNNNPNFNLTITVNPSAISDYGTNRVTVINQKGNDAYDLEILEKEDPIFYGSPRPTFDPNTVRKETETVYHRVQPRESLFSISNRYGTTIEAIKQANGITGTTIMLDQNLIIPITKTTNLPPPRLDAPSFTTSANAVRVAGNDITYGKHFSVFNLPKSVNSFTLRGLQTNSQQNQFTLQGLILEQDDQIGVLYNSVGVNSAMCSHYNHSTVFFEQVRDLAPDLIIISLGTNEAFSGYAVDKNALMNHVDLFLKSIREASPMTNVLVCTNPDAWRNGAPNPNIAVVRDVLIEAATKHQAAFWDMQKVMGGAGAMSEWVANGLGGRDYIHFTRSGYELQGELLFDALMSGY